jgi:hypothetical protein
MYTKFWLENMKGKRPIGRPRRRRKYTITRHLTEIGCEDVDWMHLAQDRAQWRALVNTVMNLHVPQKVGNFSDIYEVSRKGENYRMRGFIIRSIRLIFRGNLMQANKMDGACSRLRHGGKW